MTLPRKRRAPVRKARRVRGKAAGATFDDVRAIARKLILVRFATVDKRALPELLERAWRLVAPTTWVKQYEGKRG